MTLNSYRYIYLNLNERIHLSPVKWMYRLYRCNKEGVTPVLRYYRIFQIGDKEASMDTIDTYWHKTHVSSFFNLRVRILAVCNYLFDLILSTERASHRIIHSDSDAALPSFPPWNGDLCSFVVVDTATTALQRGCVSTTSTIQWKNVT